MDPISVIAGITTILLAAANISRALHSIYGEYADAPSAVKTLMCECYAINGALSQLQAWLCNEDPAAKSKQRLFQLDLLVNTIVATMCSFSELEAEVEKFKMSGPKLVPFKYMWKDAEMQAILRQLQSHKTSLTLMLTILSSESDSQTRKTLEEITAFMGIMAKDQKRMWYTMKRSNLFSADGRSLLSKSTGVNSYNNRSSLLRSGEPSHLIKDTESAVVTKSIVDRASAYTYDRESTLAGEGSGFSTKFAFDHDLKRSMPYRRQGGEDVQGDFDDDRSVLAVDDVSDIMSLSLPHPKDISDTSTITGRNNTSVVEKEFLKLALVTSQSFTPVEVENPDQEPIVEYHRSQFKSVFWWITTRDEAVRDWAQFWGIRSDDLIGMASSEISRQQSMHTTIQNEILYHRDLDAFVTVYRYRLRLLEFPSMSFSSDLEISAFKRALETIFKSFDRLRILHEELIVPLVTLATKEGPWVRGLSDVYFEWLPKARMPYLAFVTTYCETSIYIRHAIENSLAARRYLELCFKDERTRGLDWSTLTRKPITQVQRMRFLTHTYPPGTTDLEMHQHGPNIPFQEFWGSLEKKLEEEMRLQESKDFKSRLDIPEEFAEFIPKLKNMDMKSTIWRTGSLTCYGFVDGGKGDQRLDGHAVILDDYLLVTRKTYAEPKISTKTSLLESETRTVLRSDLESSSGTRYVLIAKVGVPGAISSVDASTNKMDLQL